MPVPRAEARPVRDRRRLGPGFWIAVGWVVVVIVICALAPLLPIADPNQTLHGPPNGGMTAHNWLGTDDGGRDLLSRTIWGGRVSLLIGFVSVAFGLDYKRWLLAHESKLLPGTTPVGGAAGHTAT